MRKGDTVEVVDDTPLKVAKRKLPFAKGATFRVAGVNAVAGVSLAGVGGFWNPARFKVVGRG